MKEQTPRNHTPNTFFIIINLASISLIVGFFWICSVERRIKGCSIEYQSMEILLDSLSNSVNLILDDLYPPAGGYDYRRDIE